MQKGRFFFFLQFRKQVRETLIFYEQKKDESCRDLNFELPAQRTMAESLVSALSARLSQLLAEPLGLKGLSDTLPGTTGIVSHYYYLYFLYFFLIFCQWKRMISEFSTKKREWYHLVPF